MDHFFPVFLFLFLFESFTVELFARCFTFITETIDLIVAHLPIYPEEMRGLFLSLLNKEHYYYFRSRNEASLASWIKKHVENCRDSQFDTFAQVEPRHISAMGFGMDPQNWVLVAHINQFGRKGGFEVLLGEQPSLEFISQLSTSLFNINDLLSASDNRIKASDGLVPRIRNHAFTLLLELSEAQLKTMDKQKIEELVNRLDDLTSRYRRNESGPILMAFAQKCFDMTILQWRLYGLDLIDRIIVLGRSEWQTPANQNQRSFNCKTVAEWIIAQKFIEKIFAPSEQVHQEIRRRAKNILQLVEENGGLSEPQLDGIFIVGGAGNEEVWDLLQAMVENITQSNLDRLVVLMQGFRPLSDFSAPMVTLLRKIAEVSSGNRSMHHHSHNRSMVPRDAAALAQLKNRAIDILWNLLQVNQGVQADTYETALAQLSKIVSSPNLPADRKLPLLTSYLEKIKSGVAVIESMSLARCIFESYKTGRHNEEIHHVDLLQTAVREHRLVTATLESLAAYKRSAHDVLKMRPHLLQSSSASLASTAVSSAASTAPPSHAASSSSPASASSPSSSPSPSASSLSSSASSTNHLDLEVLVGERTAHLKYVNTHLDFIRYLVLTSTYEYSTDTVELMWNSVMMNTLTNKEREDCVVWLWKLTYERDYTGVLTKQLLEYGFVPARLDFANLSLTTFDTFQKCFLHVNNKFRKLKPLPRKTVYVDQEKHFDEAYQDSLRVFRWGLFRYDSLWEILLRCENAQAADAVMRLLIVLHSSPHPDSLEKPTDLRRHFVDRCIAYLELGASTGASLIVNRLSKLLGNFLQLEFKQAGPPRQPLRHTPPPFSTPQDKGKGKVARAKQPVVQTQTTALPEPRTNEHRLAKQTVQQIITDVPDHLINLALYHSQWDANNAVTTLIDPVERQSLENQLRFYKIPAVEQTTEPHPFYFIAHNPFAFDLMFNLLSVQNVDHAFIWDHIISVLPTNPVIFDAFNNLLRQEVVEDWSELFGDGSAYRLLYALRIIESFIPLQEHSPARISELQDWCKAFVDRGGFAYLLQLVIEGDGQFFSDSPLSKTCLSLSLQLLHSFLSQFLSGGGDLSLLSLTSSPAQAQLAAANSKGKSRRSEAPTAASSTTAASSSQSPSSAASTSTSGPQDEVAVAQAKREVLRLSTSTGTNIVKAVDWPRFISKMLTLIWDKSRMTEQSPEDETVVMYAYFFVVASVLHTPSLVNSLYSFSSANCPNIRQFVIDSIINAPNQKIRKQSARGLADLCLKFDGRDDTGTADHVQSPHIFFLQLFTDIRPDPNANCCEYFELLGQLFDIAWKRGDATRLGFEQKYLPEMLNSVRNHPLLEKSSFDAPDSTLSGLLSVVQILFRQMPQLKERYVGDHDCIIDFLFHGCLFSSDASHRCKTSVSRGAAFDLLLELARDCLPNFKRIVALFLPLHTGERATPSITCDDLAPRSQLTNYVGLKNLTATCYINSVIQQLYMIDPFRTAILHHKLSGDNLTESPLFQLQRLFSYLNQSQRQFYDTTPFCLNYKVNGNPIDVRQQQDATEFFAEFTDRLENLFVDSPQKTLIKELFVGSFVNENRCRNEACLHYYRSAETNFTGLGIKVNEKSSLYEGLQGFSARENIDDFKCPKCEKPGMTRRQALVNLPNCLFIHLERYEFDFTQFRRFKLNHRVEFPADLDMKPYVLENLPSFSGAPQAEAGQAADELLSSPAAAATSEQQASAASSSSAGTSSAATSTVSEPVVAASSAASSAPSDPKRPDSYFKYQLVGVVIHQGQADAGHYFSLIKDRHSDRWFRFDDTFVTPFNLADLAEEAFGGEAAAFDQHGFPTWENADRNANAYYLLYERLEPLPLTADVAPSSTTVDLISSSLLHEIHDDNAVLEGETQRFDPKYEKFMFDLTLAISLPESDDYPSLPLELPPAGEDPGFDVCRLACLYFLETQPKNSDEKSWDRWVARINTLLSRNVLAARWLTEWLVSTQRGSHWLRYMLIQAPKKHIRSGTGQLLSGLVRLFRTFELPAFDAWLPPPHPIEAPSELLTSLAVEVRASGACGASAASDAALNATAPLGAGETAKREAVAPSSSAPGLAALTPFELVVINRVYAARTYAAESTSSAIRLAEWLLAHLEFARKYSNNLRYYFRVWLSLVEQPKLVMFHPTRVWAVRRQVLELFFDFFMGKESLQNPDREKRIDLADSLDLSDFFDVISILTQTCRTDVWLHFKKDPPTILAPELADHPLPSQEVVKVLKGTTFLLDMVHHGQNLEAASRIYEHWSHSENVSTFEFLKLLVEDLLQRNERFSTSVLYVLSSLLQIDDSFRHWRVFLTLHSTSGILDIIRSSQSLSAYARTAPTWLLPIVQWLSEEIARNPYVAGYMKHHQNQYQSWLQTFLKDQVDDYLDHHHMHHRSWQSDHYRLVQRSFLDFWANRTTFDIIWNPDSLDLTHVQLQKTLGIAVHTAHQRQLPQQGKIEEFFPAANSDEDEYTSW